MLVSVIMPVYNGEKYIAEAIDSILSQTFQDFELLIINDCSTDETISVIETYSDRRIRVIHNDSNLGLARVRNKGIENAKGKYIAWLDSDDISFDTRLEKQVNLLENNSRIGMCGTWVKTIGSAEHIWKYPTESETIKSTMLFYNCFATSSVILRKEILVQYLYLFDLDYPPAEDYDLWEKISRHCEVANIPEILTYYRLHSLQTTFSDEARKKQIESAWKVQKRMLRSLNIFPNKKEKEIHLKIGLQSDFEFSTREDVEDVYEWLLKVHTKNLEYKIFPNTALKENLNKELYAVCNASSMILPYFKRTPFRIVDLRYIYRIIKLFIKKGNMTT